MATSAFPSRAAALRTAPERRTFYRRSRARNAFRKPRHFTEPPTPPDPARQLRILRSPPCARPPPAPRRGGLCAPTPRRHPGPAGSAALRTGRRHSGAAARPSLPRRSSARRGTRPLLPPALISRAGCGAFWVGAGIFLPRPSSGSDSPGVMRRGGGKRNRGGEEKKKIRNERRDGAVRAASAAERAALPPGLRGAVPAAQSPAPRLCLSGGTRRVPGLLPFPARAEPGPAPLRIAARCPRRPGARHRTEGAGGVAVPASDAEGRSGAGAPRRRRSPLQRGRSAGPKDGGRGGRGPPGPERGAHLPERGSPRGGGGRCPGTSGAGRGARSRLPAPPGSPRGRSAAQPAAAARGRQRGLEGGGGGGGSVRKGTLRWAAPQRGGGGGGTGLGPRGGGAGPRAGGGSLQTIQPGPSCPEPALAKMAAEKERKWRETLISIRDSLSGGRGRGRGLVGRGPEPRRVPAGRVPIPAPRGAPRPPCWGSRGRRTGSGAGGGGGRKWGDSREKDGAGRRRRDLPRPR